MAREYEILWKKKGHKRWLKDQSTGGILWTKTEAQSAIQKRKKSHPKLAFKIRKYK